MKRFFLDLLTCAVILVLIVANAATLLLRHVATTLGDRAFGYKPRRLAQLGAAQIVPLNPFQNVVASGTAICDLRNLFGYTVERIILQLGGGALTKAMLTGIQLKANGKVIFDSTGSRTDARMQFRGITGNVAFLTIDFCELKARSKLGLMGGALDTTLGIKDLRLEVTIAGATSPTLIGYAEISTPQLGQEYAFMRPLIARVHQLTQSIGGAGTFPIVVPHLDPNSGGSLYKRIAIFSAQITGARVERNGIREYEVSSIAANSFNQVEYGRVAQASLWMIDFIADGIFEDRVLDTRPGGRTTTANVFGTFGGAETITIEAEVMEPLDVY